MRKSRLAEEQIIGILKEGEAGLAGKRLCRKHGICGQTHYRWKAKYGGLEVSEARRLRQSEEKTACYRRCWPSRRRIAGRISPKELISTPELAL
jgi:putative transposase